MEQNSSVTLKCRAKALCIYDFWQIIPNHTYGRWHFIKFCNNIVMSHASATANSSSLCFSCGWFPNWFLNVSDVHKFPVGLKWFWWLFANRYLAVNHYTASCWCYSSIWLVFAVFGTQMDHCWGHFIMSVTEMVVNSASYPLSSW